jgi:hypothetical protein
VLFVEARYHHNPMGVARVLDLQPRRRASADVVPAAGPLRDGAPQCGDPRRAGRETARFADLLFWRPPVRGRWRRESRRP